MRLNTVRLIVTLTLPAAPLAVGAQPAGKVWRIGVLTAGLDTPESPRGTSFRQGLRALEYVEGQNLALEWRMSGGQVERLPGLAAELERLFTVMARERVDAVLVHPSSMIGPHLARIAALAAQSHLPTIGVERAWVEAGGLLSYSAQGLDLFQRAASYVDKLLRGTQAADLPVEQPMRFQFVINLKTAQTLGLTIPPSILFQADEVIQ